MGTRLIPCRPERDERMKLKLPDGNFAAYLFDCDGTVVDSMPLHYIAWKTALAEWDCPFPEDLFYSWGGKTVPEVLVHIETQQGRIPFGIVSGSHRDSVIRSLTAVHLLDRFQTIVGAEDYERSKPAPDAFLIGAARLGVKPESCLVFEDTDLGIQAATAAGMASVRVPSPMERR